MLGWVKQLFRKVQFEPITLAFGMELNSVGQHIVTLSQELNGLWEPVRNISALWRYGYREETEDPFIAYVLTDPDRQTLHALRSLYPLVQSDGSLLVEMTPTILRYLRSKHNLVEGAKSQQLQISDQSARLAARIDFDPTIGIQIEAGYMLQNSEPFVPAREFTRTANGSFIKRANTFWPIIDDANPIVEKLLAESSRRIALSDVPGFVTGEQETIRKTFVTSISEQADCLRVVQDKWTAAVHTVTPKDAPDSSQGSITFQVEYRVADYRVTHDHITNRSDEQYYRCDETTWLVIDHPLVDRIQAKLDELGVERVEVGYRLPISRLDTLRAYIERRADSVIHSVETQSKPDSRTVSPHVTPMQTRVDLLRRFVEVDSGRQPERRVLPVSVNITYETGGTTFLREAQRYRSREGNPAPHILYMQYWPSYSSMNVDQQRWYFYWRSRVRHGEFLPTDMSYIFVHVYELLNLVELPDVNQAVARLKSIWQAYRSQYPRLDNYIPDWGGDLLAFKASVPAAMNWWMESLAMTDRVAAPVTNLIIHQYIQSRKPDEMPPYIWTKLTTYRPRNRFYQEHNQDGNLDRAYEKAIQVAAGYWRRTANESVLEKFTSPTLVPMRKPLFASAMVGYSHPQEITLGTSRDYLGDARLSDHLTAVVKYTENILRKQARFPSKLSGIHLDSELARALETAFAPIHTPPPPIRIMIDQARVASLHQESKVIGDMLETTEPAESPNPSKALYTDLAEMRQLWASLEPPNRLAIACIFKKEVHTVEELVAKLTAYSILPTMLIDTINEKSLKLLGDRLVYDEGGSLSLAEDFLDELDIVVKEAPSEVASMPLAESSNNGPWDDLFAHLTPVEVELVRMFADAGGLTEDEVGTIAKKYNVMANAALDGLSEKATNMFGHPPFYLDSDKWLVEDEDLKSLRLSLHPLEK